jgi:ketosteroid isomerase-like protein
MPDESTTHDLEETFRRSLEAVSRRDFDHALSAWAPDGVLELTPLGFGLLEGGPVVGHAAIRKLWGGLSAAFEDFEIAMEDFQDLGGGVTFGVMVLCGRPRGSGGFVEHRSGVAMTWSDGRIARATNYTDIDDARAAAERLAEERDHASD